MKKALITGITGQSGSFLSEMLINKSYDVHGLVRRSSAGYGNLRNIMHLVENPEVYRKKLHLHAGDLDDGSSIYRIINEVQPDVIYNLAAQADVMESFLMPEYSVRINGESVIKILETIKQINPKIKFYQASTSELYGAVKKIPQSEETEFNPQSPYSWGKLVGYQAVQFYRKVHGIFAVNGILFNHESERRGDDYLTRKVTKAVARIKLGLQKELRLGNLEAKRDWGYAPEFYKCVIDIMESDKPGDYVLGTGEVHTVQEWVEKSFEYVGLNWKDYVIQDPKLFRPAEVDILQADYSKVKKEFNFEPKVRFNELIKKMIDYDLEIASGKATTKR